MSPKVVWHYWGCKQKQYPWLVSPPLCMLKPTAFLLSTWHRVLGNINDYHLIFPNFCFFPKPWPQNPNPKIELKPQHLKHQPWNSKHIIINPTTKDRTIVIPTAAISWRKKTLQNIFCETYQKYLHCSLSSSHQYSTCMRRQFEKLAVDTRVFLSFSGSLSLPTWLAGHVNKWYTSVMAIGRHKIGQYFVSMGILSFIWIYYMHMVMAWKHWFEYSNWCLHMKFWLNIPRNFPSKI